MTAKKLLGKLSELGACADGQAFAEGKTLEKAWKNCKRPDWMLWLYRRSSNYSKINAVKVAVFAAELGIHLFEARYPKDERPRKAIEAAKNYLIFPAARAAISAFAAAAYASDAADAAARAAYADAAADAAASARAYIKKKVCDYIREVIPVIEL